MNKRLEKEIGERVVERRGWHWGLTSFAFDSWGESEENKNDVLQNGARLF